MFSLGSILTNLFAREKRAKADASRSLLVERLASHGQRAFAEVARRTGLACEAGPTLKGELRGVTLCVSIAENRDEGLMTRFEARSASARSVVLNLRPRPRGLAALFQRPQGIGDPELDALFSTTTTDLDAARAVLDERARATLLSLPDHMPLYFDHRAGELTLDFSGVEVDPDRLAFLVEWLVSAGSGRAEGDRPYRG